jgi:hypothetical protein
MLTTRDLPAGAVHTLGIWPPWPGAWYKWVLAIAEASAVPQLVARLGLGEGELFLPAEGPAKGKPCICLGECQVVTQTPLAYGPEPAYALPEVARLTREFSKPRQQADILALKKAGEEATRRARLDEDLRRQDRQRADQAAVEESRRRADPRVQLKEMRERLEKLENERRQQDAEEAAALRAKLEAMEAERRKEPPPK